MQQGLNREMAALFCLDPQRQPSPLKISVSIYTFCHTTTCMVVLQEAVVKVLREEARSHVEFNKAIGLIAAKNSLTTAVRRDAV